MPRYIAILFALPLLLSCGESAEAKLLAQKKAEAELEVIENPLLKKYLLPKFTIDSHDTEKKSIDFFDPELEDNDLYKSTEGGEMELHIDSKTKDSMLTVAYYGETGKDIYKFRFNGKLIEAEVVRYNYAVPIYIESQPNISSIEKETLKTSEDAKKILTDKFFAHKEHIIKIK